MMLRRRCFAWGVVGLLACAGLPGTALAADPFTLFLLRMIRDQVVTSAIEGAASAPARQPAPAVGLVIQPDTEAGRLRRLIDESFVHLRPEQRQDLHASLMRILEDPRNASQRGEILAAFTARAEATRQAHVQLSRLSDVEMQAVAAEAREEFAKLSPADRRDMLVALEQGVPGMPRTLHERILEEFRSVAAR